MRAPPRHLLLVPATAVALVLGFVVATARAADDAPPVPPAVPPITPTPTGAPTGPTATGPGPKVDEAKSQAIQKMVAEVREDVARIRGLEWKHAVPADVLSREALKSEMERQIKADLKPDVYEREVKLARRLGMLAADEDPLALTMRVLESGIAGFYDPKTKHFYVIEGLEGDAQRPTIAHELLHALEDQHFGLQKQTDPLEEDGDGLFAMQCVQEGSAEFTRFAYQKLHPDITKLFEAAQSKDLAAMETTEAAMKVPAFLVAATLLHYQTGPRFVTRAVAGGSYRDAVARLYADPPVSQEQVLHPSRYLGKDRDLPRAVAWPENLAAVLGAGWKGYKLAPVGELDFALWIDRFLGGSGGRLTTKTIITPKCCTSLADKASAGWDGAWIQLLEKPKSSSEAESMTAVASILAWDSADDAWEAADAMAKGLAARHGGDVAAAKWAETSAGRQFDYKSRLGRGRLVVQGDVVRWLEGAPDGEFEAAWFRLAAAAVTRDPADTWSKEKEPDPLAGAAWRSRGGAVGWVSPGEGWTIATEDGVATARRGDVELRMDARTAASLEVAVSQVVFAEMARHPGAMPQLNALEERSISGKEAARIPMDDPGSKAEARRRSIYLVPLGDVMLTITASAPKTASPESQQDIEAALEGFRFPD